MDNTVLNDLLLNLGDRRYWISLWGDPKRSSSEEEQFFTDSGLEVNFPVNPAAMNLGDILFVHRIKVAKIMFVAETASSARKATDEQIRREPWRKRWCWSIDTRNLTPTYGKRWREYSLKSFGLANEYNQTASDKVNLGRLNFGNYAQISEGFAKFLIGEIIRL